MDEGSQPKAREKLNLKEVIKEKDYDKKPQRQEDQPTDAKKMRVMKENDYDGTRPAGEKKPLTEKTHDQTERSRKDSLHYHKKSGDEKKPDEENAD